MCCCKIFTIIANFVLCVQNWNSDIKSLTKEFAIRENVDDICDDKFSVTMVMSNDSGSSLKVEHVK